MNGSDLLIAAVLFLTMSGGCHKGSSSHPNTDGGSNGDAATPPNACEPFGHFPAPTSSFTIHLSDRNSDDLGLYAPDVQAKFPSADWANINRLYIEAGTYSYMNIGNLPTRTADHPLIITNIGGQVRVGPAPSPTFGYLWLVGGGAYWTLTGRYDSTSQTGDVGFPGHRCGAYASSQNHYGFLSDDNMQAFPANQNHMGLVVSSANAYEVEFVELRLTTFAGIRLATDDNSAGAAGPFAPLDDVSIHDNYVHDTGGEGFYFGSTSGTVHSKFRNLHVFNNRVLRTANEAAQIQQLGENSEVNNNVFAWGAMNWRDAFEEDQDNASQFDLRDGPVNVHDNIFLGGKESLCNYFAVPEAADDAGGVVTFQNNYFSSSTWLTIYLGGVGTLTTPATSYVFANNLFVHLRTDPDYGYFEAPYYPGDNQPEGAHIWNIDGAWVADISLTGNSWTSSDISVYQPASNITQSGNTPSATIADVQFNASGYPADAPLLALSLWAATTGPWSSPASQPITYAVGDLVMDLGHMYRCVTATAAGNPRPSATGNTAWTDLGRPIDDVRLASASPHPGVGLLDTP